MNASIENSRGLRYLRNPVVTYASSDFVAFQVLVSVLYYSQTTKVDVPSKRTVVRLLLSRKTNLA